MATVIGVHFKKAGKVYYFDPSGVWPNPGDGVIVETARGIEYGEVVTGSRQVDDDKIVSPLKKVLRLATQEDVARMESNREREESAFRICAEKIRQHKLEMKLVQTEYTFDNSKIVFYFTANGRVDFRELVKDLASVFKTRIELRQIGVRDEAKLLGGLGICGRPLCCDSFLSDFQPVSIKMAKEQNLSLNPSKISGNCGRLMCCLKYEQDTYEETLKRLPKVGREVMTPDGIGNITEINPIRECAKVRVHTSDDSYDFRVYPVSDLRKLTAEDAEELEKARAPRPEKPPRPERPRGEKNAEKNPDSAPTEEEPHRRRYPHPKAPKNLSAQQFLENIRSVPNSEPGEGKRHRQRHGRQPRPARDKEQ